MLGWRLGSRFSRAARYKLSVWDGAGRLILASGTLDNKMSQIQRHEKFRPSRTRETNSNITNRHFREWSRLTFVAEI